MRLSIRTNARELARGLGQLHARELPFVSAVTLTRVAQRGASFQRAAMQRAFEVRSKRVLRGVRFRPASKRDWPHPKAQVGTLDEFIAQHEEGGKKRPKGGARRIAVPVRQRVPKLASGKISKRRKPRTLVREGKVKEIDGALMGPTSRRKGAPIGAFYWLRPYVTLKARLGMRENVRHVLASQHDRIFGRELDRAVAKTAERARRKARGLR